MGFFLVYGRTNELKTKRSSMKAKGLGFFFIFILFKFCHAGSKLTAGNYLVFNMMLFSLFFNEIQRCKFLNNTNEKILHKLAHFSLVNCQTSLWLTKGFENLQDLHYQDISMVILMQIVCSFLPSMYVSKFCQNHLIK